MHARLSGVALLVKLPLTFCSRIHVFTLAQELGDKFAWTVRLHNGLAACQMRMGRWEDAEGELLQVGGLAGWVSAALVMQRGVSLRVCLGRWEDAKASCCVRVG